MEPMEPYTEPEPTPPAAPIESPGPGAAEETDLQAALQAKAGELERLMDRLLRAQAEFENYRKRAAREKAEFQRFANEGLLLEMLPVLDNLERAIVAARAAEVPLSLLEGIDMTARLFRSALERAGVRPIQALGAPFDPAVHQAVAQVESAEEGELLVVEEIQRGYLLEGRMLRAAMVKVSRGPAVVSAGADEGGVA
jgi:molecular chaperone GrpE